MLYILTESLTTFGSTRNNLQEQFLVGSLCQVCVGSLCQSLDDNTTISTRQATFICLPLPFTHTERYPDWLTAFICL